MPVIDDLGESKRQSQMIIPKQVLKEVYSQLDKFRKVLRRGDEMIELLRAELIGIRTRSDIIVRNTTTTIKQMTSTVAQSTERENTSQEERESKEMKMKNKNVQTSKKLLESRPRIYISIAEEGVACG